MTLEAALAELRPKIGAVLHVSPWTTMTQERIDRFADATGDRQWIHVDPQRARACSPFGTTVAHGFLVLALYPSLRGHAGEDAPPFPGVTRIVNYGLDRLRFPSPVRAGDRLRGRFELVDATARDAALRVVERFTVEIESGDKPACVAEIVRLMFFDREQAARSA